MSILNSPPLTYTYKRLFVLIFSSLLCFCSQELDILFIFRAILELMRKFRSDLFQPLKLIVSNPHVIFNNAAKEFSYSKYFFKSFFFSFLFLFLFSFLVYPFLVPRFCHLFLVRLYNKVL